MPRKTRRTKRPPLSFLEPKLDGAKRPNVPEVRAALNPKSFIEERQTHSTGALNSWVDPQFDQSQLAITTVRRGRRKHQSTTSILDRSCQISRKYGVCKFPSLLFERSPREPSRGDKSKEICSVPGSRNPEQGHRTVCDRSAAKGQSARSSEGTASCSSALDQPEVLSGRAVDGQEPPACCATSLAAGLKSPVSPCISPPPDDNTAEVPFKDDARPSPLVLELLLPPLSPAHGQPSDILVADTPEQDYGLKVTWRRRKGLMMFLEDRAHISHMDTLIHS